MASLVVLGLFINLNQWALAVLPVVLLAPHVNISLNRHRHFFYGFYPAHLAVIALVKTALGHDGWMKAISGRMLYLALHLSKSLDCGSTGFGSAPI